MWMQHRAERVRLWWEQVQALGFAQIELSHIVTPAMLDGLQRGDVPISSVHFPAPTVTHPHDSRPADVLISSPDPALRGWAVEQCRRSIDLTAELGGKAVCIHAGRIEVPPHLEWVLYQRYYGGCQNTPLYQHALNDLLAARAANAEPYLSAIRRSLNELARYAQTAGVCLGVETRLHIYEIPSLEEAQIILAEHDPAVLGHWHDVGHVEVQANLGVASQAAWLEACGPRTVATHLHDTLGLRDHLIPGHGGTDFELVAAHLPNDALRVCELDWYFSPDEIRTGVDHLAQHGLCAPLH